MTFARRYLWRSNPAGIWAEGEYAMKLTTASNPQAELKRAVDAFEASLVLPSNVGDVQIWLENLRTAWAEASAQIHYDLKHLHPRQYEAIAAQDSELLPRIELLRVEDQAIEEERERITQEIECTESYAFSAAPGEAVGRQFGELISDGMSFISRVRKQGAALQSWYLEAFNRDGGTVD